MANHFLLYRFFGFLRLLGRFALLVYFVAGIGLLGIRYWLLPNADEWRGALESQLTDALGTEVSLGEVKAQWLGANPRLTLSDVVLRDANDQALLRLPYLRAVLDWRSILGHIQFDSIEASGLDLTIRRDIQGQLHLVGQSFSLSADDARSGELPPVLGWLSLQRRVLFTDVTLRWDDASSAGGALVLDRVRMQIDNDGRDRRFALQAAAPQELASMIDVRGELRSDEKGRVDRLDQVSGRLYVHVRDWQSQAWRPWLELPAQLESGRGSAQASLSFAAGKPDGMALDASVQALRWRLDGKDHIGVEAARLHAEGEWREWSEAPRALSFQWQGRGVSVAVAEAYEQALSFDETRLQGRVERAADGGLSVSLASADVGNADLDLHFAGHWRSSETSGSGEADIQGQATRVSVPAIVRYLPTVVSEDARIWMKESLIKGRVRDAAFRLKGELDAFPFGIDPEKGEFRLEGRLEDTQIDYLPAHNGAKGWPSVDAIEGRLSMDRASLGIHADTARMLPSAQQPALELRGVQASIPDLEHNATLSIKGETSGKASSYIALAHHSPLGELIGGVLDEATASGEWSVPLELSIPLMHSIDTTVKGSVLPSEGSALRLMPEMPLLERLSGTLEFSETAVSAKGLSGRFLGGKVDFADGIGGGQAGLRLRGRMTAPALAEYIDLKGMERLEGSIAYTARLGLDKAGRFVMEAESSLEGMRLDFPAPLGKSAKQPMALKVDWSGHKDERNVMALDIRLGSGIHARALRRSLENEGPYFYALGVGRDQVLPAPASGAEIDVQVDDFNARAWEAVVEDFSRAAGANQTQESSARRPLLPELRRFRVQADKGSIFGLGTTQLTLTGGKTDAQRWRMDISSTETAGTLFWQEAAGKVEGSIQARLDRLAIGEAGDKEGADIAESEGSALPDELDIPAIDLTVGRFTLYGKMLGELAVTGVNQERGRLWRLDKFSIDSPTASLQGKGSWQLSGERRGLQLQADIAVHNLGGYMEQIGFPGAVQDGHGSVRADLFWHDLPWSPEISGIQGTLELELDKGRFNQVNSRVARLLELLSLQSVKRLASLDFNPGGLLKNGFPYDALRGKLDLDQGELRTQDYRVVGPVGTIVIGGNVHLLRQTLDLQAVVVPSLDVSGAAIAAGIAVNPIVGVGAFLAQWLLQTPLSRAMTVEYRISGDWDNVAVEEVNADRRKAADSEQMP